MFSYETICWDSLPSSLKPNAAPNGAENSHRLSQIG